MPKIIIDRIEIYQPDGTVEVKEVEISVPTDEELIAEKEAELLKVYEDIQRLKNGN